MSVEFVDYSPAVLEKIRGQGDIMLGLMAAGVEIQIKTSGKTPFLKGNLRSSARHRKLDAGKYVVEDTAVYAAAQEAGTTRGYPMVNYTTPGTGSGWFMAAVHDVKDRAPEYAATALNAVGLGSEL